MTMAWFKKSEDGEEHMMNVNTTGRSAPEATPVRPEPRTPTQRAAETKATEPRPVEVRTPEVRAPEAAPRASVLGPTLRFRGELSAQEDLVVQGSVEGSITHTQSLTIGTDGSMTGNIRARVIVIDGKVDGDLYATESVNIRATAKVKGNVFAPRVAIQDGAFFQGQVEMQPSGAAVQEHSARLRQAALNTPGGASMPGAAGTPGASGSPNPPALEPVNVDQMLSGT
jgi:cytoskeletal protein CcmA (bactofilin family)